jgi:hypothetical protein
LCVRVCVCVQDGTQITCVFFGPVVRSGEGANEEGMVVVVIEWEWNGVARVRVVSGVCVMPPHGIKVCGKVGPAKELTATLLLCLSLWGLGEVVRLSRDDVVRNAVHFGIVVRESLPLRLPVARVLLQQVLPLCSILRFEREDVEVFPTLVPLLPRSGLPQVLKVRILFHVGVDN